MKHPRNRGTGDLRQARRYVRDAALSSSLYLECNFQDRRTPFLDRYSRMTGDQKEVLRVLLPGWTGTLTELAETVEEIA